MDRSEVFRAFASELAELIVEPIKLRAKRRPLHRAGGTIYLGCSEDQENPLRS